MKKNIILLIGLAASVIGVLGLIRECKNKKTTPSVKAAKSYKCVKKTCEQLKTCAEAKYLLEECDMKELDRDGDGIPCESLCKK
ncbi:MAG: cold-shock protein [Spirochaetae bacterium HGW-Spirochaetae-6]|jgi:uncharacterized protein YxeA|nr:MAG: cold-shock protein [Spirochaetae bacterium HGW-Spirochaetae-6]